MYTSFKKIGILALTILLSGCNIPTLTKEDNKHDDIPVFEDKEVEASLQGRWYYDNLSEEDRHIYNLMYDGISNWKESIHLGGVPLETVKRIDNIMLSEHPELFYVALRYGYTYTEGDKNNVLEYKPTYCMEKEEYDAKFKAVEKVANKIVKMVQEQTKEEYKTELLVHDYIVENVDYFTDNSQDKGNSLASFRTIYGALVEGKANCMGYASTMTYLLSKLNIQCGSMIGEATNARGKTEGHEWNFVNINDNWYFTDVCWDDPTSDGTSDVNIAVRHGYFNLTSDEIQKTREVKTNLQERGEIPKATNNDANYYIRNGLTVDSLEEYQMRVSEQFNTLVKDGGYLELKVTTDEVFEEIMDSLDEIMKTSVRENMYYGTYTYHGIHEDRMNIIIVSIKAE